MRYRRVGSLFKRNINVSEEIGQNKRIVIPNPVTYTEAEIAEEKKKLDRFSISSGSAVIPVEPEIILNKMSYFSDDGSKIAYYTKGSSGKNITIYSFNSSTLVKTFITQISVNSIPFECRTTEKCFVSNDGKYVLLSVPSVSSLYFYSTETGFLIQTITDDQTNFGSIIAVDCDFKSMVVSTSDLKRDPLITDTRSVGNSVSSIICVYKRNYNSSATQKFIKIHSRTAYAPIIDNSSNVLPYPFPYALGYALEVIEPNVYYFQGVHRTSDICCKGNVFSLSCLGLKNDQLNYKCRFWNYDSPRYYSLRSSLTSSQDNYYLKFSKDYVPGSGFLSNIKNDSFYNNQTYKSVNNISCKIFKVINSIENKDKIDGSAYSSSPIPPNMFISDIENTSNVFDDNLNKKHEIYALYNYSLFDNLYKSFDNYETIFDIRSEEIVHSKNILNDNYCYYITVVMTNDIKNIRIHRYPIHSSDNLNIFNYIDYVYNGLDYDISPNDPSIGLVKIIFKSSDRNNLENCFLSNDDVNNISGYSLNIVGYNKPFLSNPSLCSNCEFDFESNIMDETLHNCFVSNHYMFLNFNTKTIIFKIENDVCKSLKFVTEIDTLKEYTFNYNENGEFFGKLNKIYKFNRQTNEIIEKVNL